MAIVLLIALFWLGYVYLGYPALLLLLSRLKPVRRSVTPGPLPSVSVLIAARNEEKDIGWKIAETLDWDYPDYLLEILVASDASTDRTDEVVGEFTDPRVRFIRMPVRGGKNAALNALAARAHGELLFFTDANAHIGPSVLQLMAAHFSDPRVGCVSGGTSPLEDLANAGIVRGATAYQSYESRLLELEGRLGAMLVCDGAIFMARRRLFAPLHRDIANDLETPVRIAAGGHWTVFEPRAMVAESDTSSVLEDLRHRRRMASQGLLGLWLLRGEITAFQGFQFISHKLLRWLTLVPLAALLAATVAESGRPVVAGLLAAQAAFYLAALGGWFSCWRGRRPPRALALPFYILLGSLGTLIGMVDACAGKRYAIWDIATLSRGAGAGAASAQRGGLP